MTLESEKNTTVTLRKHLVKSFCNFKKDPLNDYLGVGKGREQEGDYFYFSPIRNAITSVFCWSIWVFILGRILIWSSGVHVIKLILYRTSFPSDFLFFGHPCSKEMYRMLSKRKYFHYFLFHPTSPSLLFLPTLLFCAYGTRLLFW